MGRRVLDNKMVAINNDNMPAGYQFWTGIKFTAQSGEYKSKPTKFAAEAFEYARVGSKSEKRCHSITFYAKQGEKEIGIPFSELKHFDGEKNLELKLKEFIEEKLNDK